MSLILTAGSFSLTFGLPVLSPFTASKYPRERINGPGLTYSDYGTPIREGTLYEPKCIWDFEVRLRRAGDRLTLERMYSYWLLTQPSPTLFLIDLVQMVSEPSPRTRAIAPATTEETVSGMVSYYAQFNVEFADEPKTQRDGAYTVDSIRLQELTKTTP